MAVTVYLVFFTLAMNIAASSSISQGLPGGNVNIIATGDTGTLATGNGILVTGGNVLSTSGIQTTPPSVPTSAHTSTTLSLPSSPINTSSVNSAGVSPSTSHSVSGTHPTHSIQPTPTLFTGAAPPSTLRAGVGRAVVVASVVGVFVALCF